MSRECTPNAAYIQDLIGLHMDRWAYHNTLAVLEILLIKADSFKQLGLLSSLRERVCADADPMHPVNPLQITWRTKYNRTTK